MLFLLNNKGQCPPAFTGIFCELAYDPCQHDLNLCPNGKCQREPSNFEKGYTCECDNGLLACNRTDSCLSNPCVNNATCTSKENGYSCKCLDESYAGKNCEYRDNQVSNWSEWGKWSQCFWDGIESACVEVSKRNCIKQGCKGAFNRKRICMHHDLKNCQKSSFGLAKPFSDFFVIYDYFSNLTKF